VHVRGQWLEEGSGCWLLRTRQISSERGVGFWCSSHAIRFQRQQGTYHHNPTISHHLISSHLISAVQSYLMLMLMWLNKRKNVQLMLQRKATATRLNLSVLDYKFITRPRGNSALLPAYLLPYKEPVDSV
jgi:hypothetical protein